MTEETRETYEERAGIPRWLKVAGLIALVVVLLALVIMLTSGDGGHGPQRHGLQDGSTSAVAEGSQ